MAINVNRVTLVGRLGGDPESRGRDGSFVTMSVATSRSWRDKQTGEKREKTDWHRVVVFNEQAAKFARDYAKKGDLVYVEGRLETRKYEKSPGEEVYITEVIIAPYEGVLQLMSKDGAKDGASGGESRSSRREEDSKPRTANDSPGSRAGESLFDDEIPF